MKASHTRTQRKRQAKNREENYLRPLVLPVFTPALVYSIGIGSLKPVLLLTALSLGFSHAASSAVVGTFGIVGVFAAPILGRIITRTGDRVALLAGGAASIVAMGMSIAALLGHAVAPHLARPAFVLALIVLSIGANIWSLGRQAYVAEHVPASWRARGMSTLGGMNRVGELVGPLFSTLLLSLWFMGAIYAFGILTTAIALIFITVFLAPDTPTRTTSGEAQAREKTAAEARHTMKPAAQAVPQDARSQKEKVVPSPFATVVMGVGLNALAVLRANRDVIVPLWGTHLGVDPTIITATFAISALIDTIMFVVVGGMMDRYGRLAALIPSMTIMPAGIVVMLAWQSFPGFIVGAIILGFGNGFGAGVVMTTGADLSPERERAKFLGWWQAIMNVGNASGPFIASEMTHLLGTAASLWATAGIGIAGITWIVLLIRPAYRHLGIDLRGRRLDGTLPIDATPRHERHVQEG